MLLTATRIHDGQKWLPDGTVIDVADDGTIADIVNKADAEHIRQYDGIICPGFVNTHCHLELSHMKGAVEEHTGLIPFLKKVAFTRNNYTEEEKVIARHNAFKAMLDNGVVAVGDIANTSDTLDLRVQNKMHFHSFVEALGFTPNPQKQFDYSVAVYHALSAQQQEEKYIRQSIVPHAPYSVSQQLFSLIDKLDERSLMCIHNQESRAEDEYYLTKSGDVAELLSAMNIDTSFFQPSGKSSLQTYLQWLSADRPFIFVHNTYTTRTDIEVAQTLIKQAYWCLCPNANLYIENTLPDINMLIHECDNICIGTDSLSSNHQLSVLAELHTIKKHYPDVDWELLLTWATHNGAKALQMDDVIGTIEKGKKPGLVLLDYNYNKKERLI